MGVRPGAVGGAGVERGRMQESRGLWEDTWQPLILLTPSPPRSKASLKLVILHSSVNEFSSQGCSLTATWLRELLIEKESVSGALVQPICL